MKNPLAREVTNKSIIGYAMPSMAMMLILSIYTIVDSLFVSIFVSTDALAAINIIYPAYSIFGAVGMMLATGGSAIVAREMGKGNYEYARRTFSFIVTAGFIFSLLFSGAGFLFMDQIFAVLGADGILYEYCYDYFLPLLIFLPALMLQLLFEIYFVTAGHPKKGLALVIAAGLTNAFLDYLFIVVMDMGIGGAAWATGIGTTIPAIFGLVFFFKKDKLLYFARPIIRLRILVEASFNGASEMVTYMSTGFSTLLFNWTALLLLGVDGVAAVAILLYSEFLLNAVFYGFAQGIAPIISYNHGCTNRVKLRGVVLICIRFICIFSVIIFLVANLGASAIVGIFTSKSAEVNSIALNGFLIFSFSFLFAGFNIFASSMFTALSNGKVSAFISFLRTFVFIGLGILLLPRYFDVNGLWLAMPAAEILSLMIAAFFVWREYNRASGR